LLALSARFVRPTDTLTEHRTSLRTTSREVEDQPWWGFLATSREVEDQPWWGFLGGLSWHRQAENTSKQALTDGHDRRVLRRLHDRLANHATDATIGRQHGDASNGDLDLPGRPS